MQSNTKEDLKLVEPEDKFQKQPSEEVQQNEDSGTCSGGSAGTEAEGQCSAGKTEL